MSEVSDQPQPSRRRVRTLWLWLIPFAIIAIGMTIVWLTTHVPQRPPFVFVI